MTPTTFQTRKDTFLQDVQKVFFIHLATECGLTCIAYAYPLAGLGLITYTLVDHSIQVFRMLSNMTTDTRG